MKTVDFAKMSALRNHESLGLMISIRDMCKARLVEPELSLGNKFLVSVDELAKVIDLSPDVTGADVAAADDVVDDVLINMGKSAEITTMHPNAARAAAAQKVKDILDNYSGITKQQLKEQYAKVHTMLRDLTAIPREELALAYLDEWVEELQKRYDDYLRISNQYVQSLAAIGTGKVKAAREECEELLRTFVHCLCAIQEMTPKDELSMFIDELNVLMDKVRAGIRQRTTIKKKRKEAAEKNSEENKKTEAPASEAAPAAQSDDDDHPAEN